jgi:antitoxin ParD1/3/4
MAISAELGETLEKVVADLVENGRYNSKSEVLREGVRLVQEREARLRELDSKIQAGLDDIEAGRVRPAEGLR